jgi:cold-inducible RNA-binding protein
LFIFIKGVLSMNIYVGNMPYTATESDLRELFEGHGEVESVRIITDKFTGKSRGLAFVEMPNDDDAQSAIDALNGSDFSGRTLKVNKALPRENRPQNRGGDRGGRGGFGGGRGNDRGGRY